MEKSSKRKSGSELSLSSVKRRKSSQEESGPGGDLNNSKYRENDSDSNTSWVGRAAEKRIEAFADLNEGEKNFLKLWNNYITSLKGVGLANMPAVVLK